MRWRRQHLRSRNFLFLLVTPTTKLVVLYIPKTVTDLFVLKLTEQIAFSLYRLQNSHNESIITNSAPPIQIPRSVLNPLHQLHS